mgnify:FL=1
MKSSSSRGRYLPIATAPSSLRPAPPNVANIEPIRSFVSFVSDFAIVQAPLSSTFISAIVVGVPLMNRSSIFVSLLQTAAMSVLLMSLLAQSVRFVQMLSSFILGKLAAIVSAALSEISHMFAANISKLGWERHSSSIP